MKLSVKPSLDDTIISRFLALYYIFSLLDGAVINHFFGFLEYFLIVN